MENRYKINYDIKSYNVLDVKYKQGDADSSVLEMHLFDGGKAVDITGETIEFRFLKPDKTTVYQDELSGVAVLDALNGVFECTLKANTLAATGLVFTEVVRKKENIILTSPTFNFQVEKSIGCMILSSNYIASIESKLIEWQINEEIRQATFENNEQTRQANTAVTITDVENKVVEWQGNENTRQATFENNEQVRQVSADDKIADLEKRFNDLTSEQQQDAEVIDARKGKPSLKAKMDDVDTQLNEIATVELPKKENKSEVGVFTPKFSDSVQGVEYSKNQGDYIKIGNLVHISFEIIVSKKSTGTPVNLATLSGLPFTPSAKSVKNVLIPLKISNLSNPITNPALVFATTSTILINDIGNNNGSLFSGFKIGDITDTLKIVGSGTYII